MSIPLYFMKQHLSLRYNSSHRPGWLDSEPQCPPDQHWAYRCVSIPRIFLQTLEIVLGLEKSSIVQTEPSLQHSINVFLLRVSSCYLQPGLLPMRRAPTKPAWISRGSHTSFSSTRPTRSSVCSASQMSFKHPACLM